ncbi:MAG: uncharacterized protein JWN66_4232 [Sphingomonas bacterium]|uniref:sulfotransferase n=1 Tax=Sphingomonas bacterium TaxID=1895847 RepID=UPI002614E41E|nr:sulfotransferase [Sphingomonas bacterium]MDB5707116.1 uncharacterized protein [Sphingomonas bacterium]
MRLLNLFDRRANAGIHRRRPGVKIFFIGFNKTATAAIDYFLSMQGVESVHWLAGDDNLAVEIEKRVEQPDALKRYLDRWTAYSDLTFSSEALMLEGNRHFRLFHQLYPDAYFILNDRDVEGWTASRMKHRDGLFARRAAASLDCEIEDLPRRWKEMHRLHVAAVLAYFEGNPRFLHFRVDQDDVARLIDLLAPDFRLRRRYWERRNVTGAPRRKQALAGLRARLRTGRRSFA